MPNGMVMQVEPGDALPPGHPASGRGMEGGQPTAYICQAGAARTAITSAADAGRGPDLAAAAAPAAATVRQAWS